jgi:hypothetical protein
VNAKNFQEILFECDTHAIHLKKAIYGTYQVKLGTRKGNVTTWHNTPISEGGSLKQELTIYRFLQRQPYSVLKSFIDKEN